MQTVRMAQNPQMAMDQVIRNNPDMKKVMEYVNANGGDPKAAFYKLAQEQGVDAQSILNSLM